MKVQTKSIILTLFFFLFGKPKDYDNYIDKAATKKY